MFTKLCLKYDSFVPKSFKRNLTSCLVYRAFHICSSELSFSSELEYLKNMFTINKYPMYFLNEIFKKTINKTYNPIRPVTTVLKKDVYIRLFFVGSSTYSVKRKIRSLIGRFYPQINVKFVIVPQLTIQNFFHVKDRQPSSLVSSVVYKYICSQCSATYIGETRKQLKIRMSQHQGKSFRSNNKIPSLTHSKILDHALDFGHPVDENSFKIIDSCNNLDLKVLESINIHKFKPSLNDLSSSTELYILK